MAQSPSSSLARRNRRAALAVAVAVAVLVAIPVAWRAIDQEYAHYDAYAQAGGETLPPFTPASATDIHRQHRRTAGTTFVRFTYAEADSAAIVAGLRRLPLEEVERLQVPPSGYLPWWPLSSRTMSGSEGERLHVYEVPEGRGGGYLALDPRTRSAFHWRS